MVSFKFKKGDLVIVDEGGMPTEFEIISPLQAGKGRNVGLDFVYDAKKVSSGEKRTVSEDEILRLATPVDNSAQLFRKKD
ncbi:MAG: hypothetical protein OK439_04130 [Thaumarchaeota archaeon]|nr:hypothetical protein [Nitrososphaerota archaeon]